jgi:hypothetical protein
VLAQHLLAEWALPEIDPADTLLGELDRLESALGSVPGGVLPDRVADRLRELLLGWTDAAAVAATGLGDASDDEMFDLIDKELGIS